MRQRLLGATLAILTLAIGVTFAGQARADGDRLIVLKNDFGVIKTLDRLGNALGRKGIKIFARINHASGGDFFGTPKIGTPLMISNPAIGLDLPLKAVAWQAADGAVMLAYSDPAWLAKRYGIDDRDEVFKKMAGALAKFTAMATTRGALPAE